MLPTVRIFYVVVFFLFAFSVETQAQITTSNNMTPTQMVQNVLLGSGITVSNVTYTGYANGIATFNAPTAVNLGFTSGLYLTTGSYLANDPLGTGGGSDGPFGPSSNFQSISQSTSFPPNNGDPDLDLLLQQVGSASTSNDAAVLEFDFVPQSDTVKFRYRFGSEEYNEFVPSTGGLAVADVFGFFLSGVSVPLPKTNIALLPGTTTPVSIFTVNNGNAFGPSSGPCNNCTYYTDNTNGGIDVTYDGLTTVLTAIHPVICGETYHIKIVIGDAMDEIYDSGVFLEAGSFSTNNPITITSLVNGNAIDSVMTENCDSAIIYFVRPQNTLNTAQTLNYTLSGTATNGVDYTNLNGILNFPVGVDSVAIVLYPTADGITEGLEKIILTLTQTVTICGQQKQLSFHMYIDDISPLLLNIPDTVICSGQQVALTANPSGGGGSYTYLWSTGATTQNITVSPVTTTSYWCTVTGSCGNVIKTDTVKVNVFSYSQLTAASDVLFSNNDLQFREGCDSLHFIFNRGTQNIGISETFTLVISGTALSGSDYNSFPSTISFAPGQSTLTIGVKANDDVAIEGAESIILTIPGNPCNQNTQSLNINILDTPPLQLNVSPNITLTCPLQTATLTALANGGIPSYTYAWTPVGSTSTTISVSPANTTTYTVTVTDSICVNHTASAQITVSVPVVQPMQALVNGASIHCPGQTVSLNSTVSGGYTPYAYLWNTGATTPAITAGPLSSSTTYTLMVMDACNIYADTTNYTVNVIPYIPLNLRATNDTTICPHAVATLQAQASNGVQPYTYTWENTSPGQTYGINPNETTTYYVQVKDSCGLTKNDMVVVTVPLIDAEFTYEFYSDSTVLFTNNSLGNPLTYSWVFGDGTSVSGETNPSHDYYSQAIYYAQLIAETPEGCYDSITHPIIPPMEVWVPNAFTPNKDELNTKFFAYGVGVAEFKISIFNRWGQKIFESDNISKGWDGTYEGKPCQEGVYVYSVNAVGVDSLKRFKQSGYVSLIR